MRLLPLVELVSAGVGSARALRAICCIASSLYFSITKAHRYLCLLLDALKCTSQIVLSFVLKMIALSNAIR